MNQTCEGAAKQQTQLCGCGKSKPVWLCWPQSGIQPIKLTTSDADKCGKEFTPHRLGTRAILFCEDCAAGLGYLR